MLVKAKHYSVTYPDGGHRIGEIFDLTKDLAEYYTNLGWVEILPQELQPEIKRVRKKKLESNGPSNLSNSKSNGRYLEHVFK